MAKKQTRRCVSLNRINYEALKQEATRRGMTITGLVELALGAFGVPVIAHPQQSPAVAWRAVTSRAEQERVEAGRNGGPVAVQEGTQPGTVEWPLLEEDLTKAAPVEA